MSYRRPMPSIFGTPAPSAVDQIKAAQMGQPGIRRPTFQAQPAPAYNKYAGMSRVGGLLARAGDKLGQVRDSAMAAPKGAEGLFSADDLGSARRDGLMQLGLSLLGDSGWHEQGEGPTLGQSLGRGLQAMQGGFRGALGETMQNREMARGQEEQERMRTSRARLAEIAAPRPGETEQQRFERMKDMHAHAVASGDIETANAIAGGLGSYKPEPARPNILQEIDAGDRLIVRDPLTGQEREIPKGQAPRDPNATAMLNEQRMFGREQQLTADYTKATQTHAERAREVGTIVTIGRDAARGIPQAQIALVFGYMKMLDPGSVVRESEYATAENARGVPDHVRNLWNKVKDGTRLSPTQVEAMVNQAQQIGRTAAEDAARIREHYTAQARRWGVDPVVFRDYFEGTDLGTTPGTTPPAATSIPGLLNPNHTGGALPPTNPFAQYMPGGAR